jgi:hypothetical protein
VRCMIDERELLTQFVDALEKRFGPRDTAYEILGVEFAGVQPQVVYPSKRKILVRLAEFAKDELELTLFQLAHEAVHILDPTELGGASVLEEGTALNFSLEIVRQVDKCFVDGHRKYAAAGKLASKVSSSAIKALRLEGKKFSCFKSHELKSQCPMISGHEAQVLCGSFEWNFNPIYDPPGFN